MLLRAFVSAILAFTAVCGGSPRINPVGQFTIAPDRPEDPNCCLIWAVGGERSLYFRIRSFSEHRSAVIRTDLEGNELERFPQRYLISMGLGTSDQLVIFVRNGIGGRAFNLYDGRKRAYWELFEPEDSFLLAGDEPFVYSSKAGELHGEHQTIKVPSNLYRIAGLQGGNIVGCTGKTLLLINAKTGQTTELKVDCPELRGPIEGQYFHSLAPSSAGGFFVALAGASRKTGIPVLRFDANGKQVARLQLNAVSIRAPSQIVAAGINLYVIDGSSGDVLIFGLAVY